MTQDQKPEVQAAALRILTPLALWLMEGGVGARGGARLLKMAYALAGQQRARRGTQPDRVTDSRIATLTGLMRAEIRTLLNETSSSEALDSVRSQVRAQRILWGWHNDRRFRNPDGTPRILPLRGNRSFAELVRLHSGDGRIQTSLEELQEAKAVRLTREGRLQVLRRTFHTARMDAAGIAAFGEAVSEHIRAMLHNAEHPASDALYHRRMVSGVLDWEAAQGLKRRITDRAEAFGEGIEDDLASETHAPQSDSQRVHRPLSLQIFLAEVDTELPASSVPPSDKLSNQEAPRVPISRRKQRKRE